MAHIKKIETSQRRNGRPVAHYEVRWTEVHIGPEGKRKKRYRQETLPTKAEAEDRVQEIENSLSGTGTVTGRDRG